MKKDRNKRPIYRMSKARHRRSPLTRCRRYKPDMFHPPDFWDENKDYCIIFYDGMYIFYSQHWYNKIYRIFYDGMTMLYKYSICIHIFIFHKIILWCFMVKYVCIIDTHAMMMDLGKNYDNSLTRIVRPYIKGWFP